jgi:hypothetical protein
MRVLVFGTFAVVSSLLLISFAVRYGVPPLAIVLLGVAWVAINAVFAALIKP